MALLANQIMDARILSSMNGRVELSQFLRVSNQSIVSQVTSAQDDGRKNRKYPCPLCGKRFRFNSILSLHMRTHTGEKPFKCPYCDHRAAQKGNLKIHLRTHKQGILGKGRGRIREENRLLHELEERAILRDRQMRASHVSHQQTSKTSQPPKPQLQAALTLPQFVSGSDRAEAQPHASVSPKAHEEPVQPQSAGFRCSFCKGKFRKQQELERHIRILHKPYKCTLCEFAASHEEELIGHVETAHITADSSSGPKPAASSGDKEKPVGEFPCEVCGQTFSQAWFLKGHMRKHKDSFEHCCQICGRRFKEPWFLKNHMKVHLNKLAAKSNLPAEHDASVHISDPAQDHQGNLYSQYMSRIHNRFLAAERADQLDYSQIFATASIDVKVREMLGRVMSSGAGPLTDAEGSALLGLNHHHPLLSATSMEYLQKVISSRATQTGGGGGGGGGGYPGWRVVTPALPVEQQMQRRSSFVADRRLPADDTQMCLADPDGEVASRPGSPGGAGLRGPTEVTAEAGNSRCGGALEHRPQSSSPGEKTYRCPVSGDYAAAQTAPLGFHLDRYLFPHWKNSRDLSSPLQPTSSTSSSPNPRARPRSRDDWSPAAGAYLSLENHSDNPLLVNKQSDLGDKDAGVEASLPAPTRKSQYEPLDLSVRPESVASHSAVSPAALVQMSGVFSNGLSSSITRRLQSYSNAAGEPGVKPAYQCDLSAQETKEEANAESASSACHNGDAEFEPSERGREDESDASANWRMLRNSGVELEELGQAAAGERDRDEPGQWGRAAAGTPVSSLESSTPGQAEPLQHQAGLISFLSSRGGLESAPAGSHAAGLNGGGSMEKDVVSARKPFQCRYCPYSASQKGNLKTHVLCVHRRPFDNSLYPDRRLRRSHAPPRSSRSSQSVAGDSPAPGRDQIGMTSLCGT